VDDALALLQKLSTAGFGVLAGLLLTGSYFGIWVWGKQYREEKAEWKARCDAIAIEKDEWKKTSLSLLGVAETSVGTLARRG